MSQPSRSTNSALFRRTFLTFGTQVVVAICSVVNNFIIARALGPEGKGATYMVFSVAGIIISLMMAGANQAMIYYVGKNLFSKEEILFTTTVLAFVASIAGVGIFLLIPPGVRHSLVRGLSSRLLFIALAGVPLGMMGLIWAYFAQAINEIRLYNVLKSAPAIAFTLLLIPSYFLLPRSVTEIGVAWLVSLLVGALIAFSLIGRRVKFQPAYNRSYSWKSIVFGLKANTGAILQFFNYRLDALILNYSWGNRSVGLYSVGVAMAELVWFVPQAVATVSGPEVSRRDVAGSNSLTSWAVRNTLWVSLACGLGLYIVARPLVRWLLPAFTPALAIVAILLMGIIPLSVERIITAYFIGRGKPIVPTITSGSTALLATGLYLWLIPRHGMWGAAIASSLAYIFNATISVSAFKVASKASIRDIIALRFRDFHRYIEFYRDLRSQATGKL